MNRHGQILPTLNKVCIYAYDDEATFVDEGILNIRNLSCYTCENRVEGNYNECHSDEYLGKRKSIQMKKE